MTFRKPCEICGFPVRGDEEGFDAGNMMRYARNGTAIHHARCGEHLPKKMKEVDHAEETAKIPRQQ